MHTPLCKHAEGSPTEYALAAKEAGLDEIGFSDHNPMPEPFDDWRMDISEFPEYLAIVEQAKVDVPDVTIRLGIEIDYLEGREDWVHETATMANFDYLIGSVHYIAPEWDIDNPKWIGRWKESDVSEIWDLYWKIYCRMIRTKLFDIHAHPDLAKKFGFRPEGDLRRYYEPAIAALLETDSVYEISTAGLYKDVAEIYPAQEFIELACQAGVPIVISSDAHSPGEVGRDFPLATKLAWDCGYRESQRFDGRKRSSIPLQAPEA